MQVAAVITDGTSVTIDRSGGAGGTRYTHTVDEPVYRIDYDKVRFERAATNDSSATSTLTTIEIQPDDVYTRYEDVTNSTGYGFVRWFNTTTNGFSDYSDGVNYQQGQASSSTDQRTLFSLRKFVRTLLGTKDSPGEINVSDEQIDLALNAKQKQIAHMRFWPFYEVTRSFSTVANRAYFSLPSTVQKVHTVAVDSQPLAYIDRSRWEQLHWDTTSAGDASHFTVFEDEMRIWPTPSSAAGATTLTGNHSAAITTITVASTADFRAAPTVRIIIDSEVLVCDAIGSTTTLTGCRRGQEGTTAAAHLDTVAVTERDVVYTAHVDPDELVDAYDRTAIPEPEVLAYGAAADLALYLEKEVLHDRLLAEATKKIADLTAKYGAKQTGSSLRIKDRSEVVTDMGRFRNQQDFPVIS